MSSVPRRLSSWPRWKNAHSTWTSIFHPRMDPASQRYECHWIMFCFAIAELKWTCSVLQLIPHVPADCIDLICKLLAYNPDDRLSARQALRHGYFRCGTYRYMLCSIELPHSLRDSHIVPGSFVRPRSGKRPWWHRMLSLGRHSMVSQWDAGRLTDRR